MDAVDSLFQDVEAELKAQPEAPSSDGPSPSNTAPTQTSGSSSSMVIPQKQAVASAGTTDAPPPEETPSGLVALPAELEHYAVAHPIPEEESGPRRRNGERRPGVARRSRWTSIPEKPSIQTPGRVKGAPHVVPGALGPKERKALALRVRIDELTERLLSGIFEHDDRSPSPPPTYDASGKRNNTRPMRKRKAAEEERHVLVQTAKELSAGYQPPPDYRPVVIKRTKKIFIPQDKYPNVNFMGLIIGPRGITLKKTEAQTGAKIAIRGKGSLKAGKGRRDGKLNPGDTEPMHVVITAETDKSMRAATKVINALLVPKDDNENNHKMQQLRLLAELNGTLREPTDEPARGPGGANAVPLASGPANAQLDSAVDSFFSEIGGSATPSTSAAGGGSGAAGGDSSAGAPPPWARDGDKSSSSGAPPPWSSDGNGGGDNGGNSHRSSAPPPWKNRAVPDVPPPWANMNDNPPPAWHQPPQPDPHMMMGGPPGYGQPPMMGMGYGGGGGVGGGDFGGPGYAAQQHPGQHQQGYGGGYYQGGAPQQHHMPAHGHPPLPPGSAPLPPDAPPPDRPPLPPGPPPS